MAKAGVHLKPGSVHFGRPLLAWRPNPYRGPAERRALFALHCSQPLLIGAWCQCKHLNAVEAERLWLAHPWQLIAPPPDVAGLLAAGLPLQSRS